MHMKPSTIILAVALALTSSATAYSTVPQVNADIITLDSSVKTLISAVQSYTGGLISELGIVADFTLVAANTAKGGADANNLPPGTLSVSDANSIINTVRTTLDIDNPAAVDALVAKKPLFQASGQDPLIKASLQLLLSEHLYFSEGVLERTPTPVLADANNVVDVITNALQSGINIFST